MRILLLGGTTEAAALAATLATQRISAVFSYAGRTANPVPQPIPQRVGGFGGADGLATYLTSENITHIIDATHPFAAQISRNAVTASHATGTPLLAYVRPPWQPQPADRWTQAIDINAVIAALPAAPTNIFLAIGKQHLAPFIAKPQHHYLLRLVDAPGDLPLPNATAIIGRGPFTHQNDTELLRHHAITHIVAKNAGGQGAVAKITAARALGLRVILIDRPELPPRQTAQTIPEVMAWLAHSADLGV
jgi:precorrin-6A/cobalt-precorrin-6A reductase